MGPADLGRALEQRGFESLWAPEHSHIPLARQSPFPQGGERPKKYYDVMDPFVTLAAAAGTLTAYASYALRSVVRGVQRHLPAAIDLSGVRRDDLDSERRRAFQSSLADRPQTLTAARGRPSIDVMVLRAHEARDHHRVIAGLLRFRRRRAMESLEVIRQAP